MNRVVNKYLRLFKAEFCIGYIRDKVPDDQNSLIVKDLLKDFSEGVPRDETKLKIMHVLRDCVWHAIDRDYHPSPLICQSVFSSLLRQIEEVSL